VALFFTNSVNWSPGFRLSVSLFQRITSLMFTARMRTPEALSQAIRLYQESASAEVKAYFELQNDGSFTSDTIMAEAQKAG